MSDARDKAYVVDTSKVEPDPTEQAKLIAWGADFLTCNDEDIVCRAASLALAVRDHFSKSTRARGLRMTSWQLRMQAEAFVLQCVRYRASQTGGKLH
jgi:hypothetical protein